MCRLLILGAGAVTTECYLPALDSLGLLHGTVLVDPRASSLDTAKQFPGVEILQTDFQSFTEKGNKDGRDFDVVIVALPNSLHEPAVRWALRQDHHVLCEKPLVLSSRTCQQLAVQAESAGKLLAVNMVRRKYPSYQLARQMIDAGLLGRLVRVSLTHGSAYQGPAVSLAPFEQAGGVVLAYT